MSLKSISIQLETVVSSLGAVVKKLVTMPAPSIALAKLTWAKIASAGPPLILVEVNTLCADAPQDCSPTENFQLHKRINDFLAEINRATATLAAVDSIPPPNQMLVQGITALEQGTYLFELDLAELAMWFWNYAQDPKWELAKTCLGSSAWVIDAYTFLDAPSPDVTAVCFEGTMGLWPSSMSTMTVYTTIVCPLFLLSFILTFPLFGPWLETICFGLVTSTGTILSGKQ
ncbi:hypothetical protein E4T56_gene4387 [Termitomyces sp. T112]|nr:hypothetical protein E4T56_gene4387 [Termitomyces sp. T112]